MNWNHTWIFLTIQTIVITDRILTRGAQIRVGITDTGADLALENGKRIRITDTDPMCLLLDWITKSITNTDSVPTARIRLRITNADADRIPKN